MEPTLDHMPFIAAAYSVGAVLILGYTFWLYCQRQKGRQMEKALLEVKD